MTPPASSAAELRLPLLTRDDVRAILREAGSFLLTTHVNPDGDGIGCELALLRHLRRLGKSVRILNASPLPENYRFLDSAGEIEQYAPDTHGEETFAVDVLFLLDMNDPGRVGGMREAVTKSRARRIVIDHHLAPREFADGYLIDDDTCATGEILYDVIAESSRGPLPPEVALPLYAAIMTDSGSFRFPRTTPRIHRIAAELLEAGVDPPAVHRAIYDEYPMRRTQLLGRVLAAIRPVCGGRATMCAVPRDMFLATGTTEEDTENMVNFGLAIRGIEATALCIELKDCVKVSFRSVGDFDVAAIARSLGGGGHRNASGARLIGMRLPEAEALIEETLCRGLAGAPRLNH